eukprot:1176495-Amphidinium_carterae.1
MQHLPQCSAPLFGHMLGPCLQMLTYKAASSQDNHVNLAAAIGGREAASMTTDVCSMALPALGGHHGASLEMVQKVGWERSLWTLPPHMESHHLHTSVGVVQRNEPWYTDASGEYQQMAEYSRVGGCTA